MSHGRGATPLQVEIAALRAHNRALEEQVGELQSRLEQLEAAVQFPVWTWPFKVTGREQQLLDLLLTHKRLTREFTWQVLWGHLPEADWPDVRCLDVYFHRLRKILKPRDVRIATIYGTGWSVEDSWERLRALAKRFEPCVS